MAACVKVTCFIDLRIRGDYNMTIMYVGSIPKDIVTIINYNCTFKDLEQVYIDDPIAALLVSKQKKPDVVFVDANMKLLNGYSFSAIISGYNDNCEIFLITNKENKNTAGLSDVHIISFPYILSEIVDKIQVYIAPKIIGGEKSKTSIGGQGIKKLSDAIELKDMTVKSISPDLLVEAYLRGGEK